MMFHPLKNLSIVCTFFLVAHGLFVIASMISTVWEIGLLQRIESGEFVSEAEALDNDNRQAAIGMLYLVTLVVVVISFLIWIHRASKNLAPLGWEDQRFSPGWAVGWWFIPIMSLFRPYQVVKEIWNGSYPGISSDAPTSPLLGWWWATWLLSGWIGNGAFKIYLPSDATVSDLITADWFYVVSDAITMVALVLIAILIWQVTSNQEKRSVAFSQGSQMFKGEGRVMGLFMFLLIPLSFGLKG